MTPQFITAVGTLTVLAVVVFHRAAAWWLDSDLRREWQQQEARQAGRRVR
jgi:hypothetical protein